MSWQVTRQYVDHQTGMHVIHLEHGTTKAQHKLQIAIGHDACPHCGHVAPKTNTGEIDPRALTAQELAALETVHGNLEAYRIKHQIPLRKPR